MQTTKITRAKLQNLEPSVHHKKKNSSVKKKSSLSLPVSLYPCSAVQFFPRPAFCHFSFRFFCSASIVFFWALRRKRRGFSRTRAHYQCKCVCDSTERWQGLLPTVHAHGQGGTVRQGRRTTFLRPLTAPSPLATHFSDTSLQPLSQLLHCTPPSLSLA